MNDFDIELEEKVRFEQVQNPMLSVVQVTACYRGMRLASYVSDYQLSKARNPNAMLKACRRNLIRRCRDLDLAMQVDPMYLAVEEVGFERSEVADAKLRIEGDRILLGVDLVESDWEPDFEFELHELLNLVLRGRVGDLMQVVEEYVKMLAVMTRNFEFVPPTP